MRKHMALGVLTALGFGAQAMAADDFSYSSIEGGYASTEVGDVDGDGFTLGLSGEFGENLFGFLNYNDFDYDFGLASKQLSVGLGYHWPLADNLDLVSGLSYEHYKVNISGVGSASDDGVGLSVGLRGRVAGQLELTGTVKYIDLGHGINDFTYGATGRWYFTPNFAAGPDISHNDDGTTFGVSLRYDFGRR